MSNFNEFDLYSVAVAPTMKVVGIDQLEDTLLLILEEEEEQSYLLSEQEQEEQERLLLAEIKEEACWVDQQVLWDMEAWKLQASQM